MYRELIDSAKERMDGAVSVLNGDLEGMRSGRANPKILDKVMVNVYGMDVPLQQVATIAITEALQLTIKAFDVNTLGDIEKAIFKADVGITPTNDGKVVRMNFPRLTEDSRKALVKDASKRCEEAKVAVRNVRRDVLNDIREMKDEKMITEDDSFDAQDQLQKVTDKYTDSIDAILKAKSDDIMTI